MALSPELAADRSRALALTPVSRETLDRLDRFVAVLLEWQQRMNLIASSTEPKLWTRHVADSLQLLALAPQAQIWVDLGSGAGFPGVVLACALADRPGARVHLVERSTKKAAFLREAVMPSTAQFSNIRSRDKTRPRNALAQHDEAYPQGACAEAPPRGQTRFQRSRHP